MHDLAEITQRALLQRLGEALILSPSNATALARRGEAIEGLGELDHAPCLDHQSAQGA